MELCDFSVSLSVTIKEELSQSYTEETQRDTEK